MLVFYEGAPIGPLRNLPVVGEAISGLVDGRVDRVASDAVKGYVLAAERDSLVAQMAEKERQRRAAESAVAELQRDLDNAARVQGAEQAVLEKEIAEYEKKLADAGRRCTLSDSDVEWLRNR